MNRRQLLVGGALVAAVAACGNVKASDNQAGGDPDESTNVSLPAFGATSYPMVPSDTVADWATYTDHLVIITVTRERMLDDGGVDESGAGRIGRAITVDIDRVLWSRPGAPELPNPLEYKAPGWIAREDGSQKKITDRPWPEVDHRYVVAFTKFEGWGTVGPGGLVPYDNDVIGEGGPYESRRYPAPIQNAWGQPASALADLLSRTEPDPYAAKYADLHPQQRYEKAIADRAAAKK